MNEPILHLAKRAIKEPETLRAFEIKYLALWVEAAYKFHEREDGRIRVNNPEYGSTVELINKWIE